MTTIMWITLLVVFIISYFCRSYTGTNACKHVPVIRCPPGRILCERRCCVSTFPRRQISLYLLSCWNGIYICSHHECLLTFYFATLMVSDSFVIWMMLFGMKIERDWVYKKTEEIVKGVGENEKEGFPRSEWNGRRWRHSSLTGDLHELEKTDLLFILR